MAVLRLDPFDGAIDDVRYTAARRPHQIRQLAECVRRRGQGTREGARHILARLHIGERRLQARTRTDSGFESFDRACDAVVIEGRGAGARGGRQLQP
ncbi:hypothetical protein AW168_35665 [Nocardia brasiliensis]|nr:hypothetical protein AW168_35665 [Nocardia brasiliensis]